MKSLITIISFLILSSEISAISRCDRTPDGVLRPKNTEELDKYIIEIDGNPTSYIPGDTYTVMLKYNPIWEGYHVFKEFALSVESENIDNQSENVGYLRLSNDMLSMFSRRCENTILQTSSVPKNSIQVFWVAPPKGSGCIAFRATVIETIENWYSDDGALTIKLCEEESENADLQPPILSECCACDEAKYELVFEGLWTRNTHPKDYPSNMWDTKFGDIVGASHANGETFWNYDELASENLKKLGEDGDTSGLETELKEKMGKGIRTIIKANGLQYPHITEKTFTFFRVDNKNHLVSFVSKIFPSPDWILGVSSFELCQKECKWAEQRILNLYPWDIGTDNGTSYYSRHINATPIEIPIQKIRTDNPDSPFYESDGKEMKPFAKLYLTRLKTYKKTCEENSEITTIPNDSGATEEGQSKDCLTGKWSDWSPCSETCGHGIRFKRKELLEPTDESSCSTPLVKYENCFIRTCPKNQKNQNLLPEDDDRCKLTKWHEWSSCSARCGPGTRTREKTFQNPQFQAQCENNDPSILQENGDCDDNDESCTEEEKKPQNCSTNFSPWTPCNVTCGTGIKERLRLPDDNEEYDTECSNKEEVTCYEPLCEGDETTSIYGEIPSLNQITTENIFSQPFGVVINCKVSDWSVWGPCELTDGKCGKGYRTQHRQILQHTVNGGKSCPRKLMRKRRCNIPCHQTVTSTTSSSEEASITTQPTDEVNDESIDCIMSHWSPWSPCSRTCGEAVQQRTRSIKRHPKKNGKPCESRLEQKRCNLPLACSD